MVFLHGLFGQGKNWTGIAKQLSERHRVLLLDLPHHGRSEWRERFDFLLDVGFDIRLESGAAAARRCVRDGRAGEARDEPEHEAQ